MPVHDVDSYFPARVSHNIIRGFVRSRGVNRHFKIPSNILNVPRNISGIFVRKLATLENYPCAANCLLVFWPVNVLIFRGSSG
jgi:hypothetical protein